MAAPAGPGNGIDPSLQGRKPGGGGKVGKQPLESEGEDQARGDGDQELASRIGMTGNGHVGIAERIRIRRRLRP